MPPPLATRSREQAESALEESALRGPLREKVSRCSSFFIVGTFRSVRSFGTPARISIIVLARIAQKPRLARKNQRKKFPQDLEHTTKYSSLPDDFLAGKNHSKKP